MHQSNRYTTRNMFLTARQRVQNRKEKEKAIAEKLLPFLKPERRTAAYIPIKDEVDVFHAIQTHLPAENLLVPKVISRTEMIFLPCQNLKVSSWGIPEPDLDPESAQIPEVLVIPLCGFDHVQRMGYGRGYYDRWLAAHPDVLKIGIAFDEQEGHMEVHPWDIAMDIIITPQRILYAQTDPGSASSLSAESKERQL